MIRIYADYNTRDEQGRVVLNTVGSLKDIERYRDEMREGMEVILNVQDEFEVRATLTFDEVWRAIPDMTSIRWLNPEDAPE